MADLEELAGRVEASKTVNNALDVAVEVALFEPGEDWIACRANDAGTKVIYTRDDGAERTYWAKDWTLNPGATAAALRALSRTQGNQNG